MQSTFRRLPIGKIPIDLLNKSVLRLTGARSDMIATPARAGIDFAAIRAGDGYIVVSADPVTGVSKEIGRYAMRVSANDVATCGHRPRFAESVILLPEGSSTRQLREIAWQVHESAKQLGIAIVGGHTEVTPRLGHPIVVVTAFCYVDDYVTSADAMPGDTIMVTKTAGLEGTAVLGGWKRFLDRLSVVEEAATAYGTGYVHAMHDCTEGGVLGAVFEMSYASGLGFELEERRVPVAPETAKLCRRLSIDPLRLISSGALLLSVKKGRESQVTEALSPIRATAVGTFKKTGRTLVRDDGSAMNLREAPEDELWRALARAPGRGHGP
ncbi:MAG TPA: AIR synthase family protein [Nitrososphaerales archaeon]|nr:AIR synthase family protein [Nitrososphaerales archaeon]